VEEGEEDAAALARDRWEELGLQLAEPLGHHVWERTHVFPMTRWEGQTERFLHLRVPSFAIWPALDREALAVEGIGEIRWWRLDELDAADGVSFAPRRPPVLLCELLEQGPPATPLGVGV
jgi:hypothetical protein